MDRRNILLRQFAKYSIFAFAVFILYILQSTPGFLSVFGIKPVFILPFCIVLAMTDESQQAGIIYIIGGLLTDLSSGRIVGVYSFLLLLMCFLAIVSVKFFFKPSLRNIYLYTLFAMVIMLSLDFFFSFVLGAYTGKLLYYVKNVLIISAYSAAFSIPFYFFIENINVHFIRFDAR